MGPPSLATSSCKNRPPMIHLRSQVPVISIGGWPGAIQNLAVYVQRPASGSSVLWAGPGVACLAHASIMAASELAGGFGLSSARAGRATRASRVTSALRDIWTSFAGDTGGRGELSDGGGLEQVRP